MDWYIVGALLLGSLPGISIGSYLATRISDRFLLPALASMLVLIGFVNDIGAGSRRMRRLGNVGADRSLALRRRHSQVRHSGPVHRARRTLPEALALLKALYQVPRDLPQECLRS